MEIYKRYILREKVRKQAFDQEKKARFQKKRKKSRFRPRKEESFKILSFSFVNFALSRPETEILY